MCNEHVREQWDSTLENASDEIRGICKYYSMGTHTHSSSTKVFSITMRYALVMRDTWNLTIVYLYYKMAVVYTLKPGF